MYFWVSALICLASTISGTLEECKFNLETSIGSKTPIVLKHDDILNPDNGDGVIILGNGEKIQLLCSGQNNYFEATRKNLHNATCNHNKFSLNNENRYYTFADLQCHKLPQPQTRQTGTCNVGSRKIEIGFEVNSNFFLSKIVVCFDSNKLTTHWTRNVLETSEYSCQTSATQDFKTDYFGNTNPNEIYKNTTFERGHLTPRCDFSTGPAKRMTFFYINTAPQNKQINHNNWKSLERVIRTNVRSTLNRLIIYTGTTKTMQNLGERIPVPQYFWKAVIDPESGEGIAFVGVNNVQQSIASPCATIPCTRILWLGGTFTSRMSIVQKGQIYCCTIENLRHVNGIQLPEFSEFSGGVLRNIHSRKRKHSRN